MDLPCALPSLDSALCEDMGELAKRGINYQRMKALGNRVEDWMWLPALQPLKWWGSRMCNKIQCCILSVQLTEMERFLQHTRGH